MPEAWDGENQATTCVGRFMNLLVPVLSTKTALGGYCLLAALSESKQGFPN